MATEKAYIEQYREDIDVFFGIEHRIKGEEAEQQFNHVAKKNLKRAVSEARETKRSKRQEDKKPTSGGVFIAMDGLVMKEDSSVQAWVNVKGGLGMFVIYFSDSAGWSPRSAALFEAVTHADETRAVMEPEAFAKAVGRMTRT